MQPFIISEKARSLTKPFPEPTELMLVGQTATRLERLGIIRQWLSEGIPYAFHNCPILYETIREWVARRLDVHPKEITVIGSARIGYSLAPKPSYGKPFGNKSDLDFATISSGLFVKCVQAFDTWHNDYREGRVTPRHPKENLWWDENSRIVPRNIHNGFIDPYKIPTHKKYWISCEIGNTLWLLGKKLEMTENSPYFDRASLRVYKNWLAFIRQMEINFARTIPHG